MFYFNCILFFILLLFFRLYCEVGTHKETITKVWLYGLYKDVFVYAIMDVFKTSDYLSFFFFFCARARVYFISILILITYFTDIYCDIIIVGYRIPVRTRHHFDVYIMSITLKRRRIDVKTTLCAY